MKWINILTLGLSWLIKTIIEVSKAKKEGASIADALAKAIKRLNKLMNKKKKTPADYEEMTELQATINNLKTKV